MGLYEYEEQHDDDATAGWYVVHSCVNGDQESKQGVLFVQNEHEYDHRDRQNCHEIDYFYVQHFRQQNEHHEVRYLAFDDSEEMDNDGLIGNRHATNVHPNDELRHAVHHYEACGNGHHDGDAGLNGEKRRCERYRDDLRERVLHHVSHHLGYVMLHDGYQGCDDQGRDGLRHELGVRAYLNGLQYDRDEHDFLRQGLEPMCRGCCEPYSQRMFHLVQ